MNGMDEINRLEQQAHEQAKEWNEITDRQMHEMKGILQMAKENEEFELYIKSLQDKQVIRNARFYWMSNLIAFLSLAVAIVALLYAYGVDRSTQLQQQKFIEIEVNKQLQNKASGK